MNAKKLCAFGAALALTGTAAAQYQAPPYPPPQAPVYQQPQAPVYQQPQAPVYQQPQAPAYQQPQAPAYQQPQAPAYQQPQAPPYQQPQAPPYQQPQAPPPGYAPPPAYAAPPPAYPPPPPPYQPYSSNPAAPPQAQQGIRYHPWRIQIEGGYSITQGSTVKTLLNDGGSGGLGITWFPTAAIPLGFRVDGSYTSHPQTLNALAQAGPNIADGYTDIYGGDVDAEIDLHLGLHSREYFFGGLGWYRERTTLKSVSYQPGQICWFFGCQSGYYPVYSNAQTSTTAWLNSWNAGIGFEFPLGDPATFFIDGRFLRIKQPQGGYWDFIPIRVGIRF
jgi:hypothetical protein